MSGHQPDRPASVNDDGLPGFYAGQSGGVPDGGENCGQQRVVVLFSLRIVRELKTVEVGVGNAKVFGLSSAVRPHAGETVGRTGRSGIGSKTKPSKTAFTIFAEAARDIERKTNPVADLDPVHGFAHLHDLAEILVSEDSAFLHVGPAFVHVQIGATDVGARDLHQHIGGPFDFRVRDIFDDYVARTFINECFHADSFLIGTHSLFYSVVLPSKCSLSASASARVWWTTPSRSLPSALAPSGRADCSLPCTAPGETRHSWWRDLRCPAHILS